VGYIAAICLRCWLREYVGESNRRFRHDGRYEFFASHHRTFVVSSAHDVYRIPNVNTPD
jgi:hypothetical protein